MAGRAATRAAIMAVVVLATLGAASPIVAATTTAGHVELIALSNRADLVSDGNVLVEVVLPDKVSAAGLEAWIAETRSTSPGPAAHDVTGAFATRDDGRVIGLVEGLPLGTSVLTARLPDGRGAWLEVTNHPNGGPVFSGPQLQPWTCQDTAVDEQCNQPPTFSYLYQSTDPFVRGLVPYDPDSPPDDVAMTTTDEGVTVPFVVRVEIGYQNRDQYRIAVLHHPGEPWAPWAPQEQWNGKVFIPHGGGCGGSYGVGGAPTEDFSGTFDFIPDEVPVTLGDSATAALGRGFAAVSTAMANTGHNCSNAMNAESLMMAKEHFVETYGEIRYTIGSGCSGGSIAQQTVANSYPGIYQGLIVTCSFPDTASPGVQFFDYHMLRLYFEAPGRWGPGVVWTPAQWAAVEGHGLPVNAILADELLFKAAVDPTADCGHISVEQRYHPDTNPGGVRCDIFDFMIHLFGPREPSAWSDVEQMLGRGFAGVPIGNVGVQYGLEALQAGLITPAMFVDLNEKVGGLDIDALPSPNRLVPDTPALQRLQRTGWANSASNLTDVAIIDHGGPDPGAAHDAMWAWTMRERLVREQGHHDNQVIWFGQAPIIGDPNYPTEALLAMDRWLAAVEVDERDVSLADKIVEDRPEDLHDRCSQVSAIGSPDAPAIPLVQPTLDQVFGPEIASLLTAAQPVLDPALGLVVDPALEVVCGAPLVGETFQARFSTPRGVAGQPTTYDDHNCALRPPDRDDYGLVGLDDTQWATMQAAFPEGVCDWSQPGVGKQDTLTWMTYGDARTAIFGGTPLGPAPTSQPFGPGDGGTLPATGAGIGLLALVLAFAAAPSRRNRPRTAQPA